MLNAYAYNIRFVVCNQSFVFSYLSWYRLTCNFSRTMYCEKDAHTSKYIVHTHTHTHWERGGWNQKQTTAILYSCVKISRSSRMKSNANTFARFSPLSPLSITHTHTRTSFHSFNVHFDFSYLPPLALIVLYRRCRSWRCLRCVSFVVCTLYVCVFIRSFIRRFVFGLKVSKAAIIAFKLRYFWSFISIQTILHRTRI